MSAVTALTGAHLPWPSPATEFLNGSIDYLFFSVNDGAKIGCTNLVGHGCIMSYIITTTTAVSLSGAGDYTTPGTNGCWATGGIVIDNSDQTEPGSDLYFVSLNGFDSGRRRRRLTRLGRLHDGGDWDDQRNPGIAACPIMGHRKAV